MRTMHLFAGAGGGLLADLILGHRPVVAYEWNAYACAVLRERASEGWFPGLEVVEGDVRHADFSSWRVRVDCIAAGFPCQDISSAGRGKGIDGHRSGLYREVIRAIDDVRPGFVFLENSPEIRTRGRQRVIADLVARGYAWRDGILAAVDVGAPHQRDRWWLLAANADGVRQLQPQGRVPEVWRWNRDGATKADADVARQQRTQGRAERNPRIGELEPSGIDSSTPHALRDRLEIALQRGGLYEADANAIEAAARHTGAFDWSPPDLGVCRVVDGMAHRMDRIECAGNGQVPLAAAAAWIALGGPLT